MRPTTPPIQSHPKTFHGLALVAGHPALDFLNTVKYRGANEPNDRLATFTDIVDWARAAGLISSAERRILVRRVWKKEDTERLCREIVEFREHLRALFAGTDRRSGAVLTALRKVEAAISALRPVARIDPASGVLTRNFPLSHPGDLKARIVAAAGTLLEHREILRIKVCGGDDCDWLFVDRTKANRRLWCDTRTCGNIARVRRHRSRQKAS